MQKLTRPQSETLKSFKEADQIAARGSFGNVCATLAKKGLLTFDGYSKGVRLFSVTESGRAAIAASSR